LNKTALLITFEILEVHEMRDGMKLAIILYTVYLACRLIRNCGKWNIGLIYNWKSCHFTSGI
jgi:hypothetical protein